MPTHVSHRHRFVPVALLCAVAACLLLSACGGGDGGGTAPAPDATDVQIHAGAALMDAALQTFLDAAGDAYGDPRRDAYAALEAAAAWLENQDGVADVALTDSTFLDVDLISGLRQSLRLDFRDADGLSLYRGAGAGAPVAAPADPYDCSGVQENTKVLFFTAVMGEFGIDQWDLNRAKDALEDAPLGLDVTLMMEEECTADVMATFPQYGLIFIDSHGSPDGTLTGSRVTIEGGAGTVGVEEFMQQIRSQLGVQDHQRLRNGELYLGSDLPIRLDSTDWFGNLLAELETGVYKVWASGSFVRGLGPLGETILWNGSCYSGLFRATDDHPDPMGSAYMSRGPLAYYGWTRPDSTSRNVDSRICKQSQAKFIERLVDEQCTGSIHRRDDGGLFLSQDFYEPSMTFLAQYADSTTHYAERCSSGPLVDARDGEEYATACVGDQVWMAENLRYQGAGECYGGNQAPAECDRAGRLYSIFEVTGLETSFGGGPVQGICPDGWHVPSVAETEAMIAAAGGFAAAGSNLASQDLWPTAYGATDSLGMDLIPVGWLDIVYDPETGFADYGQWSDPDDYGDWGRAAFWTSTHFPSANNEYDFMAFWMGASEFSQDFYVGWDATSYEGLGDTVVQKLPCRCVKDTPAPERSIRWH